MARAVFLGGFLGAGKTTAIGALASALVGRGLHVGAVTNDQAAELVDSIVLRGHLPSGHALPVAEVAGGCFCCRFDELTGALEPMAADGVDVALCEPVGSCTDVAATVLAPLIARGESWTVAPLYVLVDPARAHAVLDDAPDGFDADVRYIFEKQLAEADQIVLTKADTLTADEAVWLADRLTASTKLPVRIVSAITGVGIDDWADGLLASDASGRALETIDYDRYASGEAALGWLNLTARVTSAGGASAGAFLDALASVLDDKLAERGGQIAHVKASLTDPESGTLLGRVHRDGVRATDPTDVSDTPWTAARVTLNARVQLDPDVLRQVAEAAIAEAARSVSAVSTIETVASFRPSYPRPTHRLPALTR